MIKIYEICSEKFDTNNKNQEYIVITVVEILQD